MTYSKEQKKVYDHDRREYNKAYKKVYVSVHKEQIKAYKDAHKEQIKAYQKSWRDAHKEQIKALNKSHPRVYKYHNRKDYDLKRNHGITIEQYNQMFVNQNGLCAICKEHPAEGTRLSVDHDHKTGKIRGLLCIRCNAGLGHFKDEISLLLNAIKYLS